MGNHTYDMHGHEPGCPECYRIQDEVIARDKEFWRKRETLKCDADFSIIYEVYCKDGISGSITRNFKLREGDRFDAILYSRVAQSMGYELQSKING